MTGLTSSWSSSIKPRFIKQETSVVPPTMCISLPGCCFNLRISSASRTIRGVFYATCSSVVDRTMRGVLSARRACDFILRRGLAAQGKSAGGIRQQASLLSRLALRLEVERCLVAPHNASQASPRSNAKWSTLNSEIPKGEATGNLEVRPQCHVLRIEHDKSGRVAGVVYAD